MTARPPFLTTQHIPSLDGLRAFSFLLVFLAHAGLGERLIPGGLGVTVFFFLSGFLITTLMRIEFQKHGRINLRHFWLRRALRILPPLYIALALAIAATLLFAPERILRLPTIASLAFQYSNYWAIYHGAEGAPNGLGVCWSLAVEEHFYLAFPLLYMAMLRYKMAPFKQALLFWSICLAVLVWRYVLVDVYQAPHIRTYMGSDTRIDSILFGCALAVWNNPHLDASKVSDRLWKFVALPISIAIMLFCLVYRDASFRETARYSLQGIALTGIFIVAIRCSDWWLFKPFNTRLMKWIGTLSYSLYLVHMIALELLPDMPMLPRGLLALGISIGVAWLIYIVVEKPCAVWRKRLAA